jgi:hypothetical protein
LHHACLHLQQIIEKKCCWREAGTLDGHAQRARQRLEEGHLGGRRAAAASGCGGDE